MDPFQQAAETVRLLDRDRYLADLFVPETMRRHFFALHAFNAEIAHIRDVVKEPQLGEIRLQFWSDALRSGGAGHPVGQAITATIAEFELPPAAFDNLLEARRFDLYDDPMPDVNALEGYAGETSSILFQLAAMILAKGRDPGTADLAGHAGVAYLITGILRALPLHAARGQVFLPGDVLSGHALDRQSVLSARATDDLRAALADLRRLARSHLEKARALAERIDPALFAAFLPLALVEGDLRRLERKSADPFLVEGSGGLMRQWRLWRAARRHSF